jgi:chemotaxis protein CheX
MVKVKTTVEKPHLKTHPEPAYDVSGIIGFSGEIVGSVVVSFQGDCAAKLVEAFAGSPFQIGSADFADAVGELANMIAGAAKKELGAASGITCPNVIIGHGHTIARLSDVPCIVIPITTPVGALAVEVNIKVAKKPE